MSLLWSSLEASFKNVFGFFREALALVFYPVVKGYDSLKVILVDMLFENVGFLASAKENTFTGDSTIVGYTLRVVASLLFRVTHSEILEYSKYL